MGGFGWRGGHLPTQQVQETAALLRATARRALEVLRSVIGLLRENTGSEPEPVAPPPTLADLNRLVDERRAGGTDINLQMAVQDVGAVPTPLARDAYRIVQEAFTNAAKEDSDASYRFSADPRPSGTVHARQAVDGRSVRAKDLRPTEQLRTSVQKHGPRRSGAFGSECPSLLG